MHVCVCVCERQCMCVSVSVCVCGWEGWEKAIWEGGDGGKGDQKQDRKSK